MVDVLVAMDSDLLMIRPNFLSAASQLELERCLRHHREEYGIARRATAILPLDKGKSCAEIAEFLYLDDEVIPPFVGLFETRITRPICTVSVS